MAGPITPHALEEYLDNDSTVRLSQIKGKGGVAVTLLAETLLRRGHALTIFTFDTAVEKEVILTGPRLKICIGPYRAKHRARDFFCVERNFLQRAIRQENPPFIHAHWTYEYALAALDSGIPTLVTARDAPFTILRLNPTPYRFMRTLMAMAVARKACAMTANSPYTADYWRKWMLFRGPIQVVPNGIPESLFSQASHRPLPQANRPMIFGMVLAGWGTRKNPKGGIEAFGRLRKRRQDVRLHMFGRDYGPNQQACRWAQRHGLTEGIDFVGPVRHEGLMQRLADEIDVLVHPALEESFGNTLIEAMALGIPVIGGKNSGAVPWVLGEGKNGLLANVRSAKELADAMQTLVDDPRRRDELGRLGREAAQKKFSMDHVASIYEQLYANFMKHRAFMMKTPRAKCPAETAGLKVLHVFNELMASGAEIRMRSSAPYWRKAGVKGEMLSTGATPGPYAKVMEAAGYPVHHLAFAKHPRFFFAFYKLLRQGNYDLLHVHCERANFYYALVGRLAGLKVVRTICSNFVYTGFTAMRRKNQRNLLRKMGCRQVCVGPSVRDNEQYRLINPTTLITNWYESGHFRPPSENQRLAARSHYGIDNNAFVMVSVGNCSRVKNHISLIEAMARIQKEYPLFYLHVGKEEAGHPEREWVKKLGLTDRVRFLGYIEDVLRPLHAADVFVMPSLYEGFSVAAMEALGTGLLCILAEVRGLTDLKSIEGIYWAKPEAESLASALRQVARVPRQERIKLGQRQHQTVSRRYGMERAVRAYIDIYRSR